MSYLKCVEEVLAKYDQCGPGAAITAIRDGTPCYTRHFGMADLEAGIPITARTAFHLASLSKVFTALAVIMLSERSQLSLDAAISHYLPMPQYPSVTIRHLLTHSSGITNYYRLLEREGLSDIGLTDQACLELLRRHDQPEFPPGARFDYSNSNYVLLATIVAQVARMPFRQFMQQELFNPLGMQRTRVCDKAMSALPGQACGYRQAGNGYLCDNLHALTSGDGTICSTVADLCLWEKALYAGEIISRASLDLAMSPGLASTGESLQYGFGWETQRSSPALRRAHHSGSDAGFRHLITTFPDLRLTVIILSNYAGFRWEDRLAITDCLLEALR